MKEQNQNGITERPPVIVVTGHIDHGKSTLLDYIRESNIVAGEAGGITQHLSAYEVVHTTKDGAKKRITFLDTPGHEAFSGMRGRGVEAADIAILVVSAEDSVKAQTKEALKSILDGGIPYIVAINKIDKPAANIEKVKIDLAENTVYVEGFGGSIPCISVSAKTGEGIPELLDMILLVAEMEELKGDTSKPAEGLVIESNMDPKRGISATLLVRDGSIKKGMCLVAGESFAPVRLIENFIGKPIDEAGPSSPIIITGFSKLPRAGVRFLAYENKKEAEAAANEADNKLKEINAKIAETPLPEGTVIVPIIVKTDVLGRLEALEKELQKINVENVVVKIIQKGVGSVSETDIKLAGSMPNTLIIAFGVKIDKTAIDLADRLEVKVNSFDIIYKITEWLTEEVLARKPKVTSDETHGTAKIMKCFSQTKDKQVVGGKVLSGSIKSGANVKIMRREFEIGRGRITELQHLKAKTSEVAEGLEFGVMIETKTEIAPGDTIETFSTVTK